ncbi:MAG: protein-disulfide reductase DsbD domain-containing protein [Tepidisphaerales bacterium]
MLPASPPPPVDQLVTSRLAAETAYATPGRPVTLALTFTLAPGWHIYWLNPGDSGIPTQPTLELPQGWSAGPWQFPLPKTFTQPGGLVGYGYSDTVTLLVEVTPPDSFTSGDAELAVDTTFLVCETVCIPGRQRATVRVTAAGTDLQRSARETPELARTAPEGRTDFDRWRALMPLNDLSAAIPAKPVGPTPPAKAGTAAQRRWNAPLPPLPAGRSPSSVEVYPLPGEGLDLSDVQATTGESGADVSCTVRIFAGTTVVPPTILVLLVVEDASGDRRGHWVELPLLGPEGH